MSELSDLATTLERVVDMLEKIAGGIVVANELQAERNALLAESVAQGRDNARINRVASEHVFHMKRDPTCPFCGPETS